MDASKQSSESNRVDPDDAPEWTDEMFDRAELRIGDTVIRRADTSKRGRPPGSAKTPARDRPTPAPRSASTRT